MVNGMTTEPAHPAASKTPPQSLWQQLVALLCPDSVIAIVFVFAFALIAIIWLGAVVHVGEERESAIAGMQRRNASLAMAFEAYINQSIKHADQAARSLRREIGQRGFHIDMVDYASREAAVGVDVVARLPERLVPIVFRPRSTVPHHQVPRVIRSRAKGLRQA